MQLKSWNSINWNDVTNKVTNLQGKFLKLQKLEIFPQFIYIKIL